MGIFDQIKNAFGKTEEPPVEKPSSPAAEPQSEPPAAEPEQTQAGTCLLYTSPSPRDL